MFGWTHFLQKSFGLFLLFFRTHQDNPHCPSIKPLSLQCYPQYLRYNDIPIVCSSSTRGLSRRFIQPDESTLYRFHGLFKDYRQPISLCCSTFRFSWANRLLSLFLLAISPTWNSLFSKQTFRQTQNISFNKQRTFFILTFSSQK
jgi:hypothetical protein